MYVVCADSYTCLFLFPSCCCYWFTYIVFEVFVSVYFVHIVSCCVQDIFVLHSHDLCSCSFWLLFTSETILGRFHLRNDIFVRKTICLRMWQEHYVTGYKKELILFGSRTETETATEINIETVSEIMSIYRFYTSFWILITDLWL